MASPLQATPCDAKTLLDITGAHDPHQRRHHGSPATLPWVQPADARAFYVDAAAALAHSRCSARAVFGACVRLGRVAAAADQDPAVVEAVKPLRHPAALAAIGLPRHRASEGAVKLLSLASKAGRKAAAALKAGGNGRGRGGRGGGRGGAGASPAALTRALRDLDHALAVSEERHGVASALAAKAQADSELGRQCVAAGASFEEKATTSPAVVAQLFRAALSAAATRGAGGAATAAEPLAPADALPEVDFFPPDSAASGAAAKGPAGPGAPLAAVNAAVEASLRWMRRCAAAELRPAEEAAVDEFLEAALGDAGRRNAGGPLLLAAAGLAVPPPEVAAPPARSPGAAVEAEADACRVAAGDTGDGAQAAVLPPSPLLPSAARRRAARFLVFCRHVARVPCWLILGSVAGRTRRGTAGAVVACELDGVLFDAASGCAAAVAELKKRPADLLAARRQRVQFVDRVGRMAAVAASPANDTGGAGEGSTGMMFTVASVDGQPLTGAADASSATDPSLDAVVSLSPAVEYLSFAPFTVGSALPVTLEPLRRWVFVTVSRPAPWGVNIVGAASFVVVENLGRALGALGFAADLPLRGFEDAVAAAELGNPEGDAAAAVVRNSVASDTLATITGQLTSRYGALEAEGKLTTPGVFAAEAASVDMVNICLLDACGLDS